MKHSKDLKKQDTYEKDNIDNANLMFESVQFF